MTDIVTRLRAWPSVGIDGTYIAEAADTIERLHNALVDIRDADVASVRGLQERARAALDGREHEFAVEAPVPASINRVCYDPSGYNSQQTRDEMAIRLASERPGCGNCRHWDRYTADHHTTLGKCKNAGHLA
jgi:hypothetical protein